MIVKKVNHNNIYIRIMSDSEESEILSEEGDPLMKKDDEELGSSETTDQVRNPGAGTAESSSSQSRPFMDPDGYKGRMLDDASLRSSLESEIAANSEPMTSQRTPPIWASTASTRKPAPGFWKAGSRVS